VLYTRKLNSHKNKLLALRFVGLIESIDIKKKAIAGGGYSSLKGNS
jgi:hypothetical protein